MRDLHPGRLQRLQSIQSARMNWQLHATRLAAQVTHPTSRWRPVIETVPRHVFVPRWWTWRSANSDGPDIWELNDGPADENAWLDAAYADRSLVTQIGPLHADHASHDDRPTGRPTSSSTLPGLIVQLARHAYLTEGADVLDIGTGSGYGCAVLATRLGEQHVTSIDIDKYLTESAADRLASISLHPQTLTADATGPLPGTYDRIIATVAVRPIPLSWLTALRPGGRLVTTITGTGLILTADKTDDGGAAGRIEWDRGGFMPTRTGPDYPPQLHESYITPLVTDGEQISQGRYPVINVAEAWELWSMLSVLTPGIEHHYQLDDGTRTAWMFHPDGSWARATSTGNRPPTVHQSGPRRLWDLLDEIRDTWLRDGSLPIYGATAIISPDGVIHLRRGRWECQLGTMT
jgi:protein-L-isoaspartate O-methyltransferase